MAKKKYTEQELDLIEQLKSSNEMFVKSIKDAKEHGNEKGVKRLSEAREDILEQLKKIDPQLEENARALYLDNDDDDEEIVVPKKTRTRKTKSVFETLEEEKSKAEEKLVLDKKSNVIDIEDEDDEEITDTATRVSYTDIDTDEQYDIIQLPSNGECYKHKKNRIPVAYLTAYDENFITSPNLYKDGLILDYLIKHKVLDKELDLDELISGDADAIILFLRITSYGEEFPVTVTDPDTKEEFSTVVDLTKIKYREFTLKGDENGYFDYELPVSKDKIKFRYLTRKDIKNLDFLYKIDSKSEKANMLKGYVKDIRKLIKTEDTIPHKEKQRLSKELDQYLDIAQKMQDGNDNDFTRSITNRLEMSIVSVNGETDREYIAKYVKHMGARDSLMLRRYMVNHEPGVDFTVTIDRPESLGGGSFETFLEWSESVFLNIA